MNIKNKNFKIAVVEDIESQREILLDILKTEGFSVQGFSSGKEFLQMAEQDIFDIVLLDYKLDDMSGLEVLKQIKKISPLSKVIINTAFGNIELAVDSMKEGAFDFIRKPLKKKELLLRIQRTLEYQEMDRQVKYLAEKLNDTTPTTDFIFKSNKMKKVIKMALKVAQSNTNILIEGETGTGKERIAEMIHNASARSPFPIFKLNIASLPGTLIESELFGAEKGAYTGADKQFIGKLEAAHRGTLFLDEIGDLPLDSQVKLLRFTEKREIMRIGSINPLRVDVRLISATNRNLETMIKENKFREDLYYRLNVIKIKIPSLRERKEEIPYLCDFFIKKFSQRENKEIKGINRKSLKKLMQYHFPGNIRELENLMERAVILANSDYLEEGDIDTLILSEESWTPEIDLQNQNLPNVIHVLEKKYITEALKKTGGIKTRAAKILGITERMLHYRIKQLKIKEQHFFPKQ
jgi:two-component system NtrC family response regulator